MQQTDDRFVVRYGGAYSGFYLARILPLVLLFAILAALYLDEESRRWIFSRTSNQPKPFSWIEFGFLLALLSASLIDLALTLLRVQRGAIALSVSPEGITGPVFHIQRLVTWNEIADVGVDGKFLVVRRRPQSFLGTFFAKQSFGNINVPADHLDRDAAEILVATRRFAPPHQRPACAS